MKSILVIDLDDLVHKLYNSAIRSDTCEIMKLKIVGMIPVYNEVDIISEVIDNLLSQEIELVVLDNGSTDGSYEICKKYADKGLIELEEIKTSKFDWHLILRTLYDMALKKNPDWVLRCDQDELLESGIKNLNLRDAITKEDESGYNLMQFDVFEFFMTDNDNNSSKSVQEKYPYYSWQHDHAYRAWKCFSGIRVEDDHGHLPIFPPNIKYRISSKKYVLRHYRFRNFKQAKLNISNRIQRLTGTALEKENGCRHWKIIAKNGGPHTINHNLLYKYKEDFQWKCERIFQPYTFERKTRDQIFDQNGKLINPPITRLEALAKFRNHVKWNTELRKKLESRTPESLTIRNP